MTGYASYLGNRLFTNFPHTDDSIPTPFTQSPIDLSPTSIDLSQNETVPETQPPNDGPSAPQPIKKRSHKKKTEADKALETIKRKQLKWTVPEELALARGWFQQSQHSTLGNSQHRTYLWQGVSKIFHEELGKEPEYGRDATKRRAQKSRSATASPSAGSSLLHRGIYSDQLDAISSKMDTFNVFQQ
ncbi:uncharacterized protein LOC110933842 [Helianthus annuus]|uniref:uncharacterized protein LOC110933842 n=1 Tax=Helianthus annuus TaxID=4232 RepID=UPI00165329A5|nr:uncharacterized protein LOC110933842 [Helianthus annuus]